jgi:pterin-4a-carbinolamine dehydratase
VRPPAQRDPGRWTEVNGALEREFRFDDFAQALVFVNRVGELAEAADHHPDIELRYTHSQVSRLSGDRQGTPHDLTPMKALPLDSGSRLGRAPSGGRACPVTLPLHVIARLLGSGLLLYGAGKGSPRELLTTTYPQVEGAVRAQRGVCGARTS